MGWHHHHHSPAHRCCWGRVECCGQQQQHRSSNNSNSSRAVDGTSRKFTCLEKAHPILDLCLVESVPFRRLFCALWNFAKSRWPVCQLRMSLRVEEGGWSHVFGAAQAGYCFTRPRRPAAAAGAARGHQLQLNMSFIISSQTSTWNLAVFCKPR